MRKSIKIVENSLVSALNDVISVVKVVKWVNSRVSRSSSRIRGSSKGSESNGDYNKIYNKSSSTKLPRCVAFNFFTFHDLLLEP